MVKGLEDRIFNTLTYVILSIVGLTTIFPLFYVFSVSLTPYSEVLKNGGYVLFPQGITFNAYRTIFQSSNIVQSLGVTVFVTIVGTVVNLVLTTLVAYPLSRKHVPGKPIFLFMVVFTLLFSGGIIPTYLIVKATGLLNTIWSMIIPSAIWSYNVLIMMKFFETLPEELFESARMDGAGELRVLIQIVLPLSKPSIVTIGLFYAVGHWNDFFSAIMYVTDRSLFPLQVVVRDILMKSQQPLENAEDMVPTITMQMAAVIIASIPIIVIYPFLQKHFTKGMMLGSVKG